VQVPAALELRHLRYFAAVADEGTFGKAAERLGVTQPALSRQVADLEYHLGAPLVTRTARGVTVTDAGRALRDQVDLLSAALEDLNGAMERARRGIAGRCAIGTIQTSAAADVLGRLMAACRERWPYLELVFEDFGTPRQPDALRDGLIDVGLAHAFLDLSGDPDVMQERQIDDTIGYALISENHPLAGRRSIAAPELATLPFLFMPREYHPAFYDRIFAHLRALGLEPMVEDEYHSLRLTWALALDARGWTIGSRANLAHPPQGLRAVMVDGLAMPWGIDLLYRRRETNPAVLKVLAALRELREGSPAAPAAARAPQPGRRKPAARRRTRRPRA
jgi:DNA-binding transcriptional LysR family regulator